MLKTESMMALWRSAYTTGLPAAGLADSGRAKNRWSIWVSGNWRLTFEFRDGNAYVLDYEDYH